MFWIDIDIIILMFIHTALLQSQIYVVSRIVFKIQGTCIEVVSNNRLWGVFKYKSTQLNIDSGWLVTSIQWSVELLVFLTCRLRWLLRGIRWMCALRQNTDIFRRAMPALPVHSPNSLKWKKVIKLSFEVTTIQIRNSFHSFLPNIKFFSSYTV